MLPATRVVCICSECITADDAYCSAIDTDAPLHSNEDGSMERTSTAMSTLTSQRHSDHVECSPRPSAAASEHAQLEGPISGYVDQIQGNASNSAPDQDTTVAELDLRQTVGLSFQFCILWFLANFSLNASYTLTNVASSTVLSSTSCKYYGPGAK
jgi:hypothetical protein